MSISSIGTAPATYKPVTSPAVPAPPAKGDDNSSSSSSTAVASTASSAAQGGRALSILA